MQPALAHEATPLWGLTCALFISHLQLPVCGAPSWPGSDSPNRPDPGHCWCLGSTDEQSRHGQNTELDCRDGWVLAGDRHLHFAPACPCHWALNDIIVGVSVIVLGVWAALTSPRASG